MPRVTVRFWRNRQSLTARLTTWYVGLLALLLLVLGVAVYLGATRLSNATALGETSLEAHNLANTVHQHMIRGDPLSAAAAAAIAGRRMQENLVIVTDTNGHIVAQSPGSDDRVRGIGVPGADVASGATDEWLGVVDRDGSDPLAISTIRIADPRLGSSVGTMIVGTSLATAEQVTRSMLLVILGGFGVILLIAALVGPHLTRVGLRPLRTMALATGRMAAGDLSVRVHISEVHDEVGELARGFNDMAMQVEAQFAAQRAFVADASHELRSPLTALGGQLDVLVRVLDAQPAEARRLALYMRREIDRMSVLAEDLLVLARIDAQGSAALDLRPLDLRSVARDVYEQVLVLPAALACAISLELAPAMVWVCGEPYRLHQVLLNLTVNPVQHAPAGGHVALGVGQCDGLARVQVRDDGPGIPEEHFAHIFDRFYRADAARTRVDGGSGLGLAIARAIVDAHGGGIVASNAAGGGALFNVSLPIAG